MLVLIQAASGIQVSTLGGGDTGAGGSVSTKIDASKDASVKGRISITGSNIEPLSIISGPVKAFSQIHQVTDKSGKTAKVTISVSNAPDGLNYESQVLPSEGTLKTVEEWVSAEQWLTVPRAGSIKCTALAAYKTMSADASIELTKGSAKGDYVTLTGYDCKALTYATDATAYQSAMYGSGSSIKIFNHAKNGAATLGIETPVTGKPATLEWMYASSNAGSANQVSQNGHVVGKFTSTAKSGTKTTSRTSDFGTAYDLIMHATTGGMFDNHLGYYVDPSMATATTGAIQGALSKAQIGDTINAAAGIYDEDVTINKAVTLTGSGDATARSFTLSTILGPGSWGVTAPTVNVESSACLQDGVELTSYGGTLNVAAGDYLENVYIDKWLTIIGSGNPTVSSLSLWGGAVLGEGSGGITAPQVYVYDGSRINDGLELLSDSGIIIVAPGSYNDDVTIDKDLTIWGYGGPTANSFTLNKALGPGCGGITAPTVNVNPGGKIQDGVTLSSETVNVGPGYYKENIVVDKSISIRGSGKSFTGIDGRGSGSVFTILPGVNSALLDMTIRNGKAINGGGIHNSGTLTVDDCTISRNMAIGLGGGIYNDGIATVLGSTISGNTAYSGGGIYNGGIATVLSSTISGNTAYKGGGISSVSLDNVSPMAVSSSTISGNSATYGGGIYIDNASPVTFTSSTVSGNSATDGGGIYIDNASPVTFTSSTVSGNSATYGGGIYIDNASPVTFRSSTISENSAVYGSAIHTDNASPEDYEYNHMEGSFLIYNGKIIWG